MEKILKFHQILYEGCDILLEMEGESMIFEYAFHDINLSNDIQLADYSLSCSYSITKQLTGIPIDLIEVRFRHEAPADISEYQRVFNCKLTFGSTMNAIVSDADIVNIPIREPNKQLFAVFEKYAETVLSKQAGNATYTQKVGSLISKMMGENVPQIDMVAKQLAISTRNLQIKLQEEGTTYSEILDQIRKDTAIYYLKNEDVSITEISYLLGFSEPSVFHRSFKKWTNLPPRQFQMSQIATG
jgi:AraC-like DNA-binding protein